MNYLNNFSHLSYAKDFYNIFKDEFIYYEKSWYCINNNNVWIKQSEEPINVKKKITIFTEKRLETYDGIIKTKNLDNNSDIVNSYSKYKKETGSSFFETGVINFLKQNYFNDTENLFDSNPYLFSLNNKVLDLKNKIFRDIKANDFISITTGYDFEEKDDKKIEELNKILKQIYPNQDELIYTLNRVSRCFYGKSPEKIYFEVGDGGNGKSLFYSSFLKEVFGNYYCTATKSLLTSPIKIGACPELMALRNKRLIVISETDQGDIFNIGVINTISGGEDITTRPLFDKTISFEILGTVFILTNFKPKFNGPVQSNLIRRMFVVPYNSRFTEDDDLVDESCYIYKANPDIKLKDNLIQYRCQLLHLLNLNYNNKFTTPKTILNFTNEYFKNCSSSFIEWFAEKYSQIYSGPINDTKRKELVEKKYYLSISDIFESYKNSDNYRNLDKNDRRNNTLTYVKDCLIKSLYTKYFVERFQYVIGEKKENKRNILVGFVSIESNDLYIDSEHGLPEKDI